MTLSRWFGVAALTAALNACGDDRAAGAAGLGGGGSGGGGGGPGGGGQAGGAPVSCDPGMQAQGTELRATVVVDGGLVEPVFLAAPRGDARSFVVEKEGRIHILRGGRLEGVFLDLSAKVYSERGQGEQGLLGLAFHPDFARNGRFFVHYSDRDSDGDTQVSELRVSASDPDRADPASEVSILREDQPYSNHNGGSIEFGPDGMLYIGLGDGGAADDPEGRAQDLTSPLGKILRVDVDNPSDGRRYGIPPDNPDLGPGARPEIWHLGLRNPWRFSFDRLTGDLYIGDVGQSRREEIDFAPRGRGGLNFGWDVVEGEICHEPRSGCDLGAFVAPIVTYSQDGGGCSVTGGYVYRGCRMPALAGTYFYSDFCSGVLQTLRIQDGAATDEADLTNRVGGLLGNVSSFGEDGQGELYVVDYNGRILKLEPR